MKPIKNIENFIEIAEEMLEQGEIDTCINRLYVASENIAAMIIEKFSEEHPKSGLKSENKQ
jgi:hypothetical protein